MRTLRSCIGDLSLSASKNSPWAADLGAGRAQFSLESNRVSASMWRWLHSWPRTGQTYLVTGRARPRRQPSDRCRPS
jgi:hypothetical protein